MCSLMKRMTLVSITCSTRTVPTPYDSVIVFLSSLYDVLLPSVCPPTNPCYKLTYVVVCFTTKIQSTFGGNITKDEGV